MKRDSLIKSELITKPGDAATSEYQRGERRGAGGVHRR